MKKLLRYLRNYKKESALGPLFKLLEASFELLVPLVMAKIIDVGIKNSDINYILRMGGILILLGVIGLISSITAQYYAAKAAVGFATELRKDLFKHITYLSYTDIDNEGTAALITRMTSDVNQLQSGVNMTLRLFLRSPFIVFGAMVMAFTINVKAALIFVVTIILLSIVVFGIMVITMPLYKKVQKRLERVLLITRENLSGTRVIRAFGKEDNEKEEFKNASENLLLSQKIVARISALLNPITYIIINLATAALIWTGALWVNDGVITQGGVVALVNYMAQILVELIKLANLIILVSRTFASADRVNSVFDDRPSVETGKVYSIQEKADNSIEFKNVSFIYNSSKEEALTNLNFEVKSGETIGIIGGTGSGKTSIVNLIPRFYDISKGEVLINGLNIKEYDLNTLRNNIGIVPQKAVLFKGTVRDNMKWGKKAATDEEIFAALDVAQAREFLDEKGDGLDFIVAQDGKNLSGGQKQRLTIARAIVRQPKILILDDSASALDYATDAKLRQAIKGLDNDMTVIIVSQRSASIMHADKIIVLEDGCIADIGKHEYLLDNCEVYKEICLSQLSKEEAVSNA